MPSDAALRAAKAIRDAKYLQYWDGSLLEDDRLLPVAEIIDREMNAGMSLETAKSMCEANGYVVKQCTCNANPDPEIAVHLPGCPKF